MSKALLKKSLEIVEEGMQKPGNNKKKTKKGGVMDLIPESHRIRKTTRRKGKHVTQDAFIRTKKITFKQMQTKLKSDENQVEENLQRLLKLNGAVLDTETADKLIRRAKTGKYVVSLEQKAKKVESSVFTDEDFKKFEAEYFCS